ncbi:MAG: hypothetical protein WD512_16065 [Candidatus Paceibacterota bacterium]
MKQKLELLQTVELKFKFWVFPYLKYTYAEIELALTDWLSFKLNEEKQESKLQYQKALSELNILKAEKLAKECKQFINNIPDTSTLDENPENRVLYNNIVSVSICAYNEKDNCVLAYRDRFLKEISKILNL